MHNEKGDVATVAEKTRKDLLIEKRNELTRLIQEEDSKEKSAKRKWINNQKVRVGAAIMSEVEKNPEKMAGLLRLLDSFYPRDYDRKYFIEWGLSPHHKNAPTPVAAQTEHASATVRQENEPAPVEREQEPA